MAVPQTASALEKRIKKHVIGKPHRFVAVAPLGFEETLADELKYIGVECAEEAEIKVTGDGKVEFSAKITEAWKAVAYSRIANRVLMEIGSFKAENFGQLEKHAAEIPWELYLDERRKTRDERNAELVLHTTCKHSRLYHSDAVEERIRNVILKANESLALGIGCHPERSEAEPRDLAKQHFYITLIDDRCTIWQDLAGEELYKRGHERFVAEAPLKETIAAAMIFEACQLQPCDSLTTSHQPLATIIDPMAGSGTFSLEAAYIANGLIPGKCRDFALKHQPAFKEASWNFLVNRQSFSNLVHRTSSQAPFTIITSDISERSISIIRHNVDNSPLKDIYASAGEKAVAKINPQLKDFFSLTTQDIPEGTIILLNPPYGKRLDFDAPKLYTKIGHKLNEFKNCTVAILAPKDDPRNGAKYTCTTNLLKEYPALDPRNNPKAKLIETSHGGISLNALFAKI